MITATVKFGMESITVQVPDGSTVGDIVRSPRVATALGYSPDGVSAFVSGRELAFTEPAAACEIVLQNKAAKKGSIRSGNRHC